MNAFQHYLINSNLMNSTNTMNNFPTDPLLIIYTMMLLLIFVILLCNWAVQTISTKRFLLCTLLNIAWPIILIGFGLYYAYISIRDTVQGND